MIPVILVILSGLTLGSAWIIFIGPTAWDRLQGFAVLSSKITLLIILFSLVFPDALAVDVALVYSLLGFINLMLIARFIDRKGQV